MTPTNMVQLNLWLRWIFFYQELKVKCRPGEKTLYYGATQNGTKEVLTQSPLHGTTGSKLLGLTMLTKNIVPAILRLWGNATYSDDTTQLLASVRSLRNTSELSNHDRMFFARGDTMKDGNFSYCVVDFASIKSTGLSSLQFLQRQDNISLPHLNP